MPPTDPATTDAASMGKAEEALERSEGARAVRETAMEHLLATLAIVAGLSFAFLSEAARAPARLRWATRPPFRPPAPS
jgi:hypothetical protein